MNTFYWTDNGKKYYKLYNTFYAIRKLLKQFKCVVFV